MFWHFFTRTYTPFSFPAPDADLSGLTAVVTGASSGVGLETAAHLMRMNVGTLIFGVRDVAKAQKVELELRGRFPAFKGEIRIWEVEMASFESVVAFSKRVEKLDRLHICVLNAGVGASEWKVTADGWEEHLQINVLSTGLLGHLVLPVSARTAESQGNTFKPHLTFTSSMGNYTGKFPEGAHKILGALNDEKTYPSGFGGQHQRYCDGKLVVTHIAQKLAELPGAALVTVNSCCPGWTRSDVRRTLNPWVAWVLNMTCWRTEYGARIIAWSATHETSPGAFIEDCREVEPNAVLKTQKGIDAGDKVWEELVRLWITLDPEVRLMEAAAP